MNRTPLLAAVAAFVVSACSDFPRDPEGTLDRIREERSFRVGIVASGAASPFADRERAMVARVAAAAGATPRLESGAGEPLLLRLEQGELDLVIGEFQAKSPWMAHVHMLPPLQRSRVGDEETMVAAAARNGENRWIMLLDREARALAEPR